MFKVKEMQKKLKNKILYFDIETSLAEVYTFRIGSKVSIQSTQIKNPTKVICIAYMAEGWKTPKILYWDKHQCDRDMLKKFVKIANKYDVLVGQNGDAFDIKTLQGRLWVEGLPPLQDIVSYDTLKMSRQNMKLMSHKLDYKSKMIGSGGKNVMCMQDWIDISEKRVSPRTKMGPYNVVDVVELYKVFWSLVPYCKKLPLPFNKLLNADRDTCLNCSSADMRGNGMRGGKQRWLCGNCGKSWTDSRALSTTNKILDKKKKNGRK